MTMKITNTFEDISPIEIGYFPYCYVTLLEVKTGITFRVFCGRVQKIDVTLQWKHLRDKHHDNF